MVFINMSLPLMKIEIPINLDQIRVVWVRVQPTDKVEWLKRFQSSMLLVYNWIALSESKYTSPINDRWTYPTCDNKFSRASV